MVAKFIKKCNHFQCNNVIFMIFHLFCIIFIQAWALDRQDAFEMLAFKARQMANGMRPVGVSMCSAPGLESASIERYRQRRRAVELGVVPGRRDFGLHLTRFNVFTNGFTKT